MNLLGLAFAYFVRRRLLLLSAVGLALGVAVLFTVLAVVDGFLVEMERTMRDFTGDVQVRVSASAARPASIADYRAALNEVPGLGSVEPRLSRFALVGRRGSRSQADPRSADLSGILLVGGPDSSQFPTGLPAPPLLLGDAAASRLGVAPGDFLEVVTYRPGSSGNPVPIRATFAVSGLLDTGQYQQDLDRAVVRASDLSHLLQRPNPFDEIVLRTDGSVTPEELLDQAALHLSDAGLLPLGQAALTTWRASRSNFLRAVEHQKRLLATVYFFLILVAAYQLLATLTLTVTEKTHDIGVLAALGADPPRIRRFFLAIALAIATVGSAGGLILGRWLAANLNRLENWLAARGLPLFDARIYQFDEIPIHVDPTSVATLIFGTLVAASVFSLIPAWRASRMPIVTALRRP